MSILAVIPARGGSKGVPGKNIKEICGLPLIAHTILSAQKSRVDRIVVSTDDENIATVARQYGAEVLMRPADLALDSTPTLPVLLDVVARLDETFDAIMTLQPTSPLRTCHHIDEAICLFQSDVKADSLVSIVEVPHSMTPTSLMSLQFNYVKKCVDEGEPILRRQEKPVFYARNGAAIYITKRHRLNQYIWGGKILPYKMSKLDSFDIDDAEDFVLCEMILKDRLSEND